MWDLWHINKLKYIYQNSSFKPDFRITDKNGKETTLHLTKDDAFSLAEAIEGAASSIGYDNT